MLKLLPNRAPGLTAAELHQQLEEAGHRTTKRTVERDLNELSSLFPLHCNDKGTPYGWYWQPGRSIDLPGITVGEALTLRLVEDSIRPLVPGLMLKSLESCCSQARQKLAALGEESASARWVDKVASVQPARASHGDGEKGRDAANVLICFAAATAEFLGGKHQGDSESESAGRGTRHQRLEAPSCLNPASRARPASLPSSVVTPLKPAGAGHTPPGGLRALLRCLVVIYTSKLPPRRRAPEPCFRI
jgi:hypothetical protein